MAHLDSSGTSRMQRHAAWGSKIKRCDELTETAKTCSPHKDFPKAFASVGRAKQFDYPNGFQRGCNSLWNLISMELFFPKSHCWQIKIELVTTWIDPLKLYGQHHGIEQLTKRISWWRLSRAGSPCPASSMLSKFEPARLNSAISSRFGGRHLRWPPVANTQKPAWFHSHQSCIFSRKFKD